MNDNNNNTGIPQLNEDELLIAAQEFQALGLPNIAQYDVLVPKLHEPETIRKTRDCFGLVIRMCIDRHGRPEGVDMPDVGPRKLLVAYMVRYFPMSVFPMSTQQERTLCQAAVAMLQSFDNIMLHLLDTNNNTSDAIPHEVTEGFVRRVAEFIALFNTWHAANPVRERIETTLLDAYRQLDENGANIIGQEIIEEGIARLRNGLERLVGAAGLRAFDERRLAGDTNNINNVE